MNSTVMVQKSVKDSAAQRAKKEGLSLSTVTRFLLQGYADGKLNIGLVPDNRYITNVETIELDSETQSLIDKSAQKWKNKIKV